MSEELIINEINENKEEYIFFLQDLIRAESYNPPGNELNVAKVIKEYLSKENIHVEIFEFDKNRANLIARLNENTKDKILLYNGHMDVVPPGNEEDWKYDPLSGEIKRKKLIFGRGTTDMKGGLAAMAISLKILKKLGINLSGNLILNAVADEETGGKLGSKWSVENALNNIKPDFVVVGEATGLKPLPKAIILGEKGHLLVKVIAHGKSCHSSIPSLGKNAIYMINEFISNLNRIEKFIPKINPPLNEEQLKDLMSTAFPNKNIFEKILSEQPLLQNLLKSLTEFTCSVTMISGGIKENVIPDNCEIVVDFRLLPDQEINQIIEGMVNYIEEILRYPVKLNPDEEMEGEFFEIKIINATEGSYWHKWRESSALKTFYDIVKEIYNKNPFYMIFPAAADANYFRNTNFCPNTILFGPGNASTAHAVNESIEISDYIDAIKVYTLFAYRFLK